LFLPGKFLQSREGHASIGAASGGHVLLQEGLGDEADDRGGRNFRPGADLIKLFTTISYDFSK